MAVAEDRINASVGFTPITDQLGSEVSGIDLSAPIDDEVFRRIRRELCERSLLVFHGQDWTPEQHIEFSRRFGPLENHVLSEFCLDGHPEIFVVSNIIENGKHVGAYGGSKRYHSDLSYMPNPSMGSVFHCLECPEGEGETCFTSMFAVYDALPEERRAWLDKQMGVHDYVWNYARNHPDRPPLSEEQAAATPPVSHPVVIRHPETGRKALYLSAVFVRRFEGMADEESQEIVRELVEFASQPQFEYAHSWTPGDVIIWDNRSLLHKALPFDETNARRRMHRTTMMGARPVLNAE